MDNIMQFPETFEEFAKSYGFKDSKEIYTNGSELIPVFRVEQWLEHARVERTCEIELDKGVPDFIKDSLDTYFCANCGSPIYNDMKPTYCIYCGFKGLSNE